MVGARAVAVGFVVLAAALVAMTRGASAAEPSAAELQQKFQETIAASRMTVTLDTKGARLSGPGAAFLKAQAGASQFVLIGEEHGVATIADVVRAMLPDLSAVGYRHFGVEADPYMTVKLEALLRAGGTEALAKFLAVDGQQFAVPFFNWSAEAELGLAAVKANAAPALWGLDQSFIGAAYVLLSDVAAQASSGEARSLAAGLAAKAKGNLEFLGKVDLAELRKLRGLLVAEADRPLAQLLDDMILSARIYQPFVGVEGGFSVYAANLERENFMKRNFLARYRAAGAPKVFFKFGANHMMRGLSSTHVPSLAQFVSDVAMEEGKATFYLLILCGPGTKAGDFTGNEAACDIDLAKVLPELSAHLDAKQPTLFDLGPWKDKPRRWAHVPEDLRAMIWAYDAVLVVPNGAPAKPLMAAP